MKTVLKAVLKAVSWLLKEVCWWLFQSPITPMSYEEMRERRRRRER